MYRYAVVHKDTKLVKTVIIWDGQAPWPIPDNHYMVRHEQCDTGDLHNPEKNEFIKWHTLPENQSLIS